MPYFTHSEEDRAAMLSFLEKKSVDELFESIPERLRQPESGPVDGPHDELWLAKRLDELRDEVTTFREMFRGAGAYHHYIPAAVDEIVSRQEYYTAYTPYQAEASQGTLQAIFEYQTMMTELTGLSISNASLYDGASAVAEAILMVWRSNRKQRVLVSAGLHPQYQAVVGTYLRNTDVEIVPMGLERGTTDLALLSEIDLREVSSVVVQSPNYLGYIEDVHQVHEAASTTPIIQVTNEALALGVLRSPKNAGAAVCCGEAQSLGIPLSFGGPYLGYLTSREEYLHFLPGRIFGATCDRTGGRAFTMTLAAREQHIRRERATSNICTNHALCAIRAAVYLALLGPEGIQTAACTCAHMAHRLHRALLEMDSVEIEHPQTPFFNEFTAKLHVDDAKLTQLLRDRAILGPLPLREMIAGDQNRYLFAATEMNTEQGIQALLEAVREAGQ